MTTRERFIQESGKKIQFVRSIDDSRWEAPSGYPAVFFDISACDEDETQEISDQLDDILSEMSSASFEDGSWSNEDFAPIAVLGCPSEDLEAGPSYPARRLCDQWHWSSDRPSILAGRLIQLI